VYQLIAQARRTIHLAMYEFSGSTARPGRGGVDAAASRRRPGYHIGRQHRQPLHPCKGLRSRRRHTGRASVPGFMELLRREPCGTTARSAW
jgi:hypothetical protein